MNITGSSKLLRNICEHLLTLGTYATLAEVLGWQKKKYIYVGVSAERLKSSCFDSCPQNQLFLIETINMGMRMTQH